MPRVGREALIALRETVRVARPAASMRRVWDPMLMAKCFGCAISCSLGSEGSPMLQVRISWRPRMKY